MSVSEVEAAPQPEAEPVPARPRRDRLRRVRWTPVVAIVVYLLLVGFGITTSSLGAPILRENPSVAEDSTLGTPQTIRSDEWLTATPSLLGITASGDAGVTTTPLAEAPDLVLGIPTSGGAASVVFFEVSALRLGTVLPDASLFAAYWWLPYLLVVLALPPWLRRIGANVPMSWLATGFVLFAPATAWWSGTPVKIIGFTSAACVLAMMAAESWWKGRRLLAVPGVVAGGILLARVPSLYQPWVVVLAVPIVLATAVWLLRTPGRRLGGLVAGAAVAVIGGGLFLAVVAANHDAFQAALDTVYPGRRRSTGGPNSQGLLFGAPVLGFLQSAPLIKGSNYSEVSGGFTLAGVWALVVAAVGVPRPRRTSGSSAAADPADPADPADAPEASAPWRSRWLAAAPFGVLVAALVGWALWVTTSWGGLGSRLPGLNLVPSLRAAQVVGFLASLVLAVVLSRRAGQGEGAVRRALVAATAVAAVTLWAGSSLQTTLPTLRPPLVAGIGALVFVLVFLVTWQPGRRRWVALTLVAAAGGVVAVNPIQFGLGDLRDSAAARRMLAVGDQARAGHRYWASDGMDTDGLLLATGVPSLTGHQMTGPDDAAWRRLDPTSRYESTWNRGASYVEMTWTSDTTPRIAEGTTHDQIMVSVDPCVLDSRGFPMGGILSSQPLTSSCLVADGRITWDGAPTYLYRVS